MSQMGQKQTLARFVHMSALPRKRTFGIRFSSEIKHGAGSGAQASCPLHPHNAQSGVEVYVDV
jgi:hypothetical protein